MWKNNEQVYELGYAFWDIDSKSDYLETVKIYVDHFITDVLAGDANTAHNGHSIIECVFKCRANHRVQLADYLINDRGIDLFRQAYVSKYYGPVLVINSLIIDSPRKAVDLLVRYYENDTAAGCDETTPEDERTRLQQRHEERKQRLHSAGYKDVSDFMRRLDIYHSDRPSCLTMAQQYYQETYNPDVDYGIMPEVREAITYITTVFTEASTHVATALFRTCGFQSQEQTFKPGTVAPEDTGSTEKLKMS